MKRTTLRRQLVLYYNSRILFIYLYIYLFEANNGRLKTNMAYLLWEAEAAKLSKIWPKSDQLAHLGAPFSREPLGEIAFFRSQKKLKCMAQVLRRENHHFEIQDGSYGPKMTDFGPKMTIFGYF